MLNANNIVEKFSQALDEKWGYIYGASGETWTQAKQDAATREQTIKWGQQWVGRRVADCSGLFVWAFKQCGGSIYHGSNTIWKQYLSAKGKLENGKRDDGAEMEACTAVFKTNGDDRHHIGLYVGNGIVIEAKGTCYGVVTSDVKTWDEWGELKDVDYHGGGGKEVLCKARVTGGSLRMRSKPDKTASVVENMPSGSVVDVYEKGKEWWNIGYNGKTGYAMCQYLTEITEGDKIELNREIAESMYNALKEALGH